LSHKIKDKNTKIQVVNNCSSISNFHKERDLINLYAKELAVKSQELIAQLSCVLSNT